MFLEKLITIIASIATIISFIVNIIQWSNNRQLVKHLRSDLENTKKIFLSILDCINSINGATPTESIEFIGKIEAHSIGGKQHIEGIINNILK